MDTLEAVKRFRRLKVLTIEQLVDLLGCSLITARRYLKKWRAHTSFNMNGRYYTLPEVPRFDENGIWRYREIYFSRYGNLMQTMCALIRRSERGLSARQIAEVVGVVSNSSVFSRLQQVPGIRRERHQGRFVYFSDERYAEQKAALDEEEQTRIVSDAEAVMILVDYIKHPHSSVEELARRVQGEGRRMDPATIRSFLGQHDLLKKIPDTG
ncbi:MAG: hypothetical protein JRH13_16025 [Deltaproteobacteria bacterium]|nr:hypothetical protein [Deltaproteobacteria bacterium]